MDWLQGLTKMNPIVGGLRRKRKYGLPTFWLRFGSKKNSAGSQIFRLARMRLLSQIPHVLGRGDSMIPELPILMVGFVFAFLGAIVMGVF